MTVFAPRFTSHDPQVEEWWENQRVKSKSLELAIRLLVKQYGTPKKSVESAPKKKEEPKKEEPKKEEPKKVDPEKLITASEKQTVAKPSTQELSPDDILAMMSNQAGSL